MSKKMLIAAAVCAAMVAPALAAGGPDATAARAFLLKLYSHYPQKQNGPFFDPVDKNAADVFEPGMIAAFKEDSRLAKGEVGFVDGDPICMCQDDGGMTWKMVSVTIKGANADAVVNLNWPGGDARAVTIHLVPVKGQWRIYDLSTKDEPSYRADLLKANKDAAAGHH
jgi:hypothetical protein